MKSFLFLHREHSETISEWLLLLHPHPHQSDKDIFFFPLAFLCENLVGFLEVKPMKIHPHPAKL